VKTVSPADFRTFEQPGRQLAASPFCNKKNEETMKVTGVRQIVEVEIFRREIDDGAGGRSEWYANLLRCKITLSAVLIFARRDSNARGICAAFAARPLDRDLAPTDRRRCATEILRACPARLDYEATMADEETERQRHAMGPAVSPFPEESCSGSPYKMRSRFSSPANGDVKSRHGGVWGKSFLPRTRPRTRGRPGLGPARRLRSACGRGSESPGG